MLVSIHTPGDCPKRSGEFMLHPREQRKLAFPIPTPSLVALVDAAIEADVRAVAIGELYWSETSGAWCWENRARLSEDREPVQE